jgi:hypothetical protein
VAKLREGWVAKSERDGWLSREGWVAKQRGMGG